MRRRPGSSSPTAAPVSIHRSNGTIAPALLDSGVPPQGYIAALLESARGVGASRRQLLLDLRDALQQHDDRRALDLAAKLVGLAEP